MRLALMTVFFLVLGSTSSLMVDAADWPQWRGANRDAKCTEKLISKDWDKNPPKLLWTVDGYGNGYASVSIVNGKLYTMGNTPEGQAVICADANDGKIIWKKTLTTTNPVHDYAGSRCTPSIDGDRLYVVSSEGAISCLKIADGELVWHESFQDEWNGKLMSKWGYSESPLVDGEVVLCTPGGPNALVVCLDKMTGKVRWKTPPKFDGGKGAEGAGYSSIVISNAFKVKQYVQLTGRGLIGIRANDGTPLWNYTHVANGIANIPTPIVDGNFIFASTSYKTGSGLVELKKSGSDFTAEEKYFLDSQVFNNHHGGMILHKGHIYAGHQQNEGFPTCINMKSGEIVWGGKLRGPGKGSAAVLYIDEHVIFRYQDGTIALIEATPKEYILKGVMTPDYQEDKSWAHPVVANGKLYLREQDKLMCYEVSTFTK
jgi:outer membrane protein assembly factor BamB